MGFMLSMTERFLWRSAIEHSTYIPTYDPSSYPTSVPSSKPTISPTRFPTFSPTSIPTRVPTSSPTCRPTYAPVPTVTHYPTLPPTFSMSPTFVPSLSPSISFITLWKEKYDTYINGIDLGARSTFASLVVKGERGYGTCDEWDVFVNDDIVTTLITYAASSLSMISTVDYSADLESVTVTCNDSATAADIVATLLSVSKATVSSSMSFKCHDTRWMVGRCGSMTSAFLCANCTSSPCTPSTVTPSAIIYDSPCDEVEKPLYPTILNILHIAFTELSVASDILSVTVSSTTNSITATVAVDVPEGSLVRAAYLTSDSFVPSTVSTLLLHNDLISITSTTVPFIIDGLIASSDYDVYCATYSALDTPMDFDLMRGTKSAAKTACCRILSVELIATSYSSGEDMAVALKLDAGDVIPNDLNVSLAAFQNSTVYPFVPSSVAFTSSSIEYVAYIRQNAGVYALAFTMSGLSASDYVISYIPSSFITVLAVDAEPAVPVLKSATFLKDGTKILVLFDAPTNRAGYINNFNCMDVFSFPGIQKDTKCLWVDDSRVSIFPGANGVVGVSDVITLRANKIRAKCKVLNNGPACSTWQFSSLASIRVHAPQTPIVPALSIISPSLIGPCDSLPIDISGSKGSGGRPFVNVSFNVYGTHENVSLVTAYLNTNYEASGVLIVPRALLYPGVAYSISVVMCNFIGGCGRSTHPFVVSSSENVPVVSLNSKKLRLQYRYSPLSVTGQAYTSVCGGATSTANILYSWKIFAQGAPLSLVSLASDPRTFKLLPYTLEVGTVYTVTLTAQHTDSLKYSSASVSVTVVKGLVVTKVSGSSSRGVRTDSSTYVDASGSYDEDNNEATGIGAELSFAFTCAQTYPSYKAVSELVMSAISPSQVSLSVPQNASDTMINSVHQLTVKVFHTKDFRSSTTTVVVTVLPSLAPLVTLSSSSGTRINPSQKFKLLATVEVAAGGTATWSVDDPSIHLQSVSLSEVTKAIALPASSREVYTLSLVLPPYTLPQESKFSFQLACSLDTGYAATAGITISTNSPPYPGSYSVSPPTGTMLDTDFTFLASKWEDSDIPLSYEFAYQGSSGAYLVHRSRLELSYVSTDLPAGRDSADFMLRTRLQVFDILDAKIASYRSVEVKRQELSAEDKRNYLADALANSNGYADEMKKAIATTTSILNGVNCSSAPNCTSLNRFDCTTTASTCGECLEGYAGESGHANTYCLHLSDDKRRRLSMGSSIPTSCTRNSDCDVTQWEMCDSNVCVIMPKACPGECSYSGYCQYVSVYNVNVTYTTCNVLSVHCKAICACYDGFTGQSCEYSVDELNQTLQTRHQLAEAIRSVSLLEDPSADTIVSWIEGLASICSDSSGIEDKTKDLIAFMAVEFIADAIDLGLSYEDITAVSTVLDLVLDADPSAGRTSFVLYQAYYDFILLDMVEGQNSIDVVSNLFRFTCLSLDGRDNSTVTSPRTILEDLVGSSSQTAVIPQSAYQTAFKVAVVESLVSHFSNDTYSLSVPFGLRFDNSPCNSSSSDACNLTVVLQNVKSIPDSHVSDDNDVGTLYLDCEKGEPISQEYKCLAGDIITLSCNGSSSGTVSRSCPVHDFSVTCDAIGDDSVSCTMIEYTGFNTTCECTLPLERQRRRMQESESSDDSAVSVDFASVSRSILIEFVDTWTSADDLSGRNVVGSIHVLLTVGFIGLFGILSVIGAYHLDNRDKASEKDYGKSIESEGIYKMSSLLSRRNRVTPSSSRSGRQLITKSTSLTDAIIARVFRSSSNVTVQPQFGRAKLAQAKVQNSVSNKDVQMIEDALPMVLRRVPLWKKVSNEVQIYHRWIGVVCHYSPTYARPIRIMSLLMNILTMLFIEAITYDIADPDDGSCETYTSRKECLKEKSSLSRSESKCYWDTAEESCSIRPISNDFERVLMVALFAAAISTPIAISLQSLIMFILSAERRQEGIAQRRRQLSRISTLERGDSHDAAHIENSTSYNNSVPMVEISGNVYESTLHEDYARLLNDIKRFRSVLSDSEREEFDCVWGEELTADVKDSMILKLTKLFASFTEHSENTGQAVILSELSNVRKRVQREALYFGNPSITREDKNKRLVYLFIKDLMDSANGQILDAKDRRDNVPKRKATLFAKVCTWVFLSVVAAAMLLYIYLFAMRQTETRQKAWFYSFVVWLIFNVTLVCTGMVIIQHIVIPFMTMKDVMKIKRKVTHDIVSFKQNSKNYRSLLSVSDGGFNAARYLYPSVRLASLYPNLPESRLIEQYSTPWPKKSVKTNTRSMQRNYDTRFQFLTQAFSRVLLFAVTSMIELPEPIQDMTLEIVSTFGLGYIVVLHVRLFRLNPVLAFVPCVIVAIILHFMMISGRGSTRLDFAGALPSSESVSVDPPSVSPRSMHPAEAESDFDNEPRKSNVGTVQRESHPPSNEITTRIRRCSSRSTCEDERTGSIGIVLGGGSEHAHLSVCSSAPSDIGTVHDGHVSWEDSDEYDPDSIYMVQNGLRWPDPVGDESDFFGDRVVPEWLEQILHIGSLRECQEIRKQDDISTRCAGGTKSGEFNHNEDKIELEESSNSSGGFMNQRSVSDSWVLNKDAIMSIDSCSLNGEDATVETKYETGLEGFGDVVEEIQWEDDAFLGHTSQHFVT